MPDPRPLNWSTLKCLAVSPKFLKWRLEHPRVDTPALRLGRAIDCAILEPEEFGKRWVVATVCQATTKAGKPCENGGALMHEGAWYCRVKGHAPEGSAEPADIEVLSQEDFDLATSCASAVGEHSVASNLLDGSAVQQTLEWTDPCGIRCRGRLDAISTGNVVVDLKSTRVDTPGSFQRRECPAFLYHGQVAWYHDGAIRAGRIPEDAPPPRLITVSTGEMPDVSVFVVGPPDLDAGRNVYMGLLRQYQECEAADWWPGHSPDERVLELPPWAPGMEGSL